MTFIRQPLPSPATTTSFGPPQITPFPASSPSPVAYSDHNQSGPAFNLTMLSASSSTPNPIPPAKSSPITYNNLLSSTISSDSLNEDSSLVKQPTLLQVEGCGNDNTLAPLSMSTFSMPASSSSTRNPVEPPVSKGKPVGQGKDGGSALAMPEGAVACGPGAERLQAGDRDLCPELPLLAMQKVVQPKEGFCITHNSSLVNLFADKSRPLAPGENLCGAFFSFKLSPPYLWSPTKFPKTPCCPITEHYFPTPS